MVDELSLLWSHRLQPMSSCACSRAVATYEKDCGLIVGSNNAWITFPSGSRM